MKKYFITFALLALIAACGTGSGNNNTTASATDITTNPDYVKGLALVAKDNCLTCHKIEEKIVGPAYREVANKYAGNDTALTYLAHKIIKGGHGVWGSVDMTPHDSLSESDAEQMVKYILLLKTK